MSSHGAAMAGKLPSQGSPQRGTASRNSAWPLWCNVHTPTHTCFVGPALSCQGWDSPGTWLCARRKPLPPVMTGFPRPVCLLAVCLPPLLPHRQSCRQHLSLPPHLPGTASFTVRVHTDFCQFPTLLVLEAGTQVGCSVWLHKNVTCERAFVLFLR